MSPWVKCLALQASWHKVQTKGLLAPLSFNEGLSSPVPPGKIIFPALLPGPTTCALPRGGARKHRMAEKCTRDASSRCSGCPLLAPTRQTKQKQHLEKRTTATVVLACRPSTAEAKLAGTYTGCLNETRTPLLRALWLENNPAHGLRYTGYVPRGRPHNDDEHCRSLEVV